MDQQQKEKLIEQWLKGDLAEQELLQSISQEELDQYKAILNTVDIWVPDGSNESFNNLKEVLASKKGAKVVSINRKPWIMGIAASIALLAALSYYFLGNTKQEFYAERETLEIMLPDNTTKVLLSPGARLSYTNFDSEDRKVEIEGRVYFDVTQKGPFEVKYPGGNINVLGTQFEIVQFEDFFEATCFEGSVEVLYKEKRAKMRARDKVAYRNKALNKSQTRRNVPGWTKDDQEEFENDILLKVIRIIEMMYRVSTDTGNISMSRRFTGTIPTDDLEVACRKVFSTLGITYKIENNKIILSE